MAWSNLMDIPLPMIMLQLFPTIRSEKGEDRTPTEDAHNPRGNPTHSLMCFTSANPEISNVSTHDYVYSM